MSTALEPEQVEKLKAQIVAYPDYPKPGILFQDIWPMIGNPESMKKITEAFAVRYQDSGIDAIVGLESRGFILGIPLSMELGIPFVPVRKKGKLPGPVVSASYQKEYGMDVVELSCSSVQPGQKVLIIDDVIATGGSMKAVLSLISQVQASVHELATLFQIEGVPREDLGVPCFELFQKTIVQ